MIVEELFGSLVSLVSSFVLNAPSISNENIQGDHTLIFEENSEREEVHDGLIHREYEQVQVTELPYYEEDIYIWGQDDPQPSPNLCESILRSLKTNVGIIMAVVFVLGLFIVGVVYLDLNTSNACTEWIQNNLKVPSNVKDLQVVGMTIFLLPASMLMLWGWKEFRNNYISSVCAIVLVTTSIICVYKILMFEKVSPTKDTIWT